MPNSTTPDTPLDLDAITRHVVAVEDDDLANIPEDIADNVDRLVADTRALVVEVKRLRSGR